MFQLFFPFQEWDLGQASRLQLHLVRIQLPLHRPSVDDQHRRYLFQLNEDGVSVRFH